MQDLADTRVQLHECECAPWGRCAETNTHAGGMTDRTLDYIETAWRAQGPSGHVFDCPIYRTAAGFEVQVRCDSTPLTFVHTATLEGARARADGLRAVITRATDA